MPSLHSWNIADTVSNTIQLINQSINQSLKFVITIFFQIRFNGFYLIRYITNSKIRYNKFQKIFLIGPKRALYCILLYFNINIQMIVSISKCKTFLHLNDTHVSSIFKKSDYFLFLPQKTAVYIWLFTSFIHIFVKRPFQMSYYFTLLYASDNLLNQFWII